MSTPVAGNEIPLDDLDADGAPTVARPRTERRIYWNGRRGRAWTGHGLSWSCRGRGHHRSGGNRTGAEESTEASGSGAA